LTGALAHVWPPDAVRSETRDYPNRMPALHGVATLDGTDEGHEQGQSRASTATGGSVSAATVRERFPRGAMDAALPGRVLEQHQLAQVRTISPDESIPDGAAADILFIHAHPDDESLDFGTLMAKASRSGKRIATVLFTDGEGGYDRYPERPSPEGYPSSELDGAELAEIRVKEAQRALSILGSALYVRLGRPNQPYASIEEELKVEEVLDRWGGLERNVERLLSVIGALQPEIVVSPPGPTEAPEHFEHEAVGSIVQEALRRLDATESHSVRGYLVAADPEHRSIYSSLVSVLPGDGAPGPRSVAGGEDAGADGSTPLRELQLAALRQYVTQYDASVAGIRTRGARDRETYAPLAWRLEHSLERWLDSGESYAAATGAVPERD
jgi:LmbE family N-acetylglucosaminyl deacetylase